MVVNLPEGSIDTPDIAPGAVEGEKLSPDNSEFAFWNPSTTQALSSGTYIDFGQGTATITVPTWATKARVSCCINGTFQVTNSSDHNVRVVIGSDNGRSVRRASQGAAGAGDATTVAFNDEITLTSTGSKTLKIQGQRVAGTGTWNIGTSSSFDFIITYIP